MRLAAACLAGLLLIGAPTYAQEPIPASPLQLAFAKAAGFAPAWADVEDIWWPQSRKEGLTWYVYDCLQDTETGFVWVLRSKRFNRRRHTEGRKPWDWTLSPSPLTAEQLDVCNNSAPSPPGTPPGAAPP